MRVELMLTLTLMLMLASIIVYFISFVYKIHQNDSLLIL